MSSVWTEAEEDECRAFLAELDEKIGVQNEATKKTYHSLHISYIMLRNTSFLTFLVSLFLQLFGAHARTTLGIQSCGLLILLFLFGRFEFSGLNEKWFRGMRIRSSLIALRERVDKDLKEGAKRFCLAWTEYVKEARSIAL